MSSLAFLVTELQVSHGIIGSNAQYSNEIVFGERNEKEASRNTRGVCLSVIKVQWPRAHDEAVSRQRKNLWLSYELPLSKPLRI